MKMQASFSYAEPEFSFSRISIGGKENSVVNLAIFSRPLFTIIFPIGKARSVVTTPNKITTYNSIPGLSFS